MNDPTAHGLFGTPVLRKMPEPEPRDRMTPCERRERLDSYAAGRLLRVHFEHVRRYPNEAIRALKGEPPSVERNPRAVTSDDLLRSNRREGRVGEPPQ
jgi:hypothetical protein